MLKLHNTSKLPLAVFFIPAAEDGKKASLVLEPGASTDVELQPGDSMKARIATEITDPVDAPKEA